jgi:hypothetical protein
MLEIRKSLRQYVPKDWSEEQAWSKSVNVFKNEAYLERNKIKPKKKKD